MEAIEPTGKDINLTNICFPSPFTYYVELNDYNLGFPAQFLITQWWSTFPALQALLYVFGGIQLALALVGISISFGRFVDPQKGLVVFVERKIIVFFNNTWQLALSGLILFLPTQWLSNVTMGMILYHSWSEFFALVLRFMIVRGTLNKQSYELFWKWVYIAVIVSAIPYMLTFNPYIQGIMTVVFVLPADFLNLVLAPLVSALYVKRFKKADTLSKVSEVLIGILNVVHVIFFYGQGIIACLVSVEAGAIFFVVLQILSTFVYGGAVMACVLTVRRDSEWVGLYRRLADLFACCPCNKGYEAVEPDESKRLSFYAGSGTESTSNYNS